MSSTLNSLGGGAEDSTAEVVTRRRRVCVTVLSLLLAPLVRISNVLLPSDSDIGVSSDGGRLEFRTDAPSHAVYWWVAVYLGSLIGISARGYEVLEPVVGPGAAVLYLAVILCLASLLVYGPAWVVVGRREEVGADE
jgi:hypothetical protein